MFPARDVRNKQSPLYLRRRRPITAGGGGIRDAARATPYAPAENICPMLPPRAYALCSRREHRHYAPAATSENDTSNFSSVQIGTCFSFFDRFPCLKQRSDGHGKKPVEKRKASTNLNAALCSGNARKTVEKRKASANLNAALGTNKIPPNIITQMFRTSQPQLCLLDDGTLRGTGNA